MIKGKKTVTITFRMTPEIKNILKTIAENECRSMASMIELLIRDCGNTHNLFEFKGNLSK